MSENIVVMIVDALADEVVWDACRCSCCATIHSLYASMLDLSGVEVEQRGVDLASARLTPRLQIRSGEDGRKATGRTIVVSAVVID